MEGSAASPAVTAAMVARSRGLAGPRFSPDGRRLAWVETAAGRSDLVVAPAAGSVAPAAPARVVPGGNGAGGGDVACGQPGFSPGGEALAFVCDRTGWMNVWVGDGAGQGAKPLIDEPLEHAEPTWGAGQRSYAWAPDGGALAVCRNEGGFGRLVVVPIDGDPRPAGKGWHHFL